MGDRRDYNDLDALWDALWGNGTDYPGVLASISEAVSSQLPGRTNGPADAYRHLLWAAELTRRFGEAKARELLEFHEEMGELKGDRADEIAMDRYNNELGIAIGREARDWAGVVARARLMMSAASQDGSGDYARRKPHHAGSDESAPMWLDSERWSNNPVREGGEDRLPTDETNWYTNPIVAGSIGSAAICPTHIPAKAGIDMVEATRHLTRPIQTTILIASSIGTAARLRNCGKMTRRNRHCRSPFVPWQILTARHMSCAT